MAQSPSITVGIVNYNGAGYLERLLSSLARQTVPHQVIVVDNASVDGSARSAHENFPGYSYLPLRRNTGFAHAANLAAAQSTDDLIVYVNPDTEPRPDFLEQISGPFRKHDRLAAVAGTLVFESQPEKIASAGISLHRNGVALDHRLGEAAPALYQPAPVFGASGGAAAYRRDVFLEAGGFPDAFFMYLEDVDLAFRLQLAGWDAVWQPAAVATHAYSASAVEGSSFKRRLIARNRIWTLARCLPRELMRRDGLSIAAYDAMAFGYGVIFDRPSAAGRASALARLAPRLCERRQIAPDSGDIARIERWLQPAISPLELRAKRDLTARLASSG
ncbi:MAG: glycosyltransferase family 2 protein [Thermomicrobiales bacterium]